ncbi:MAG: hypothetical protein AAGF31_02660 [Planctomycetota bacterium]
MTVYELWLPILLGGLAVHVASTIAWIVLPHHKPDWQKLPVEDEFQDWIAERGVPAGQYLVPHATDGAEMQSDAFQEKMQGKCRGMLVLWSTPPNMGANIGLTLAFFMVSTFVIGYLASLGVPRGAEFLDVFQFVFTAAFLTHVFAGLPTVIWFRRKVAMDLLDGLAYSVILGLIFAALWPAATA